MVGTERLGFQGGSSYLCGVVTGGGGGVSPKEGPGQATKNSRQKVMGG